MPTEITRVGATFPVKGCRVRGRGKTGIVQSDGTIEWRRYRDVRRRLVWKIYDLTGRWVIPR
jgi:hypothetical protein